MIADALSKKQPNKEILLQAVRNGHIDDSYEKREERRRKREERSEKIEDRRKKKEEYTMVINIYLMNSLYYRFQMNNMEWIFDGIDFKW